MAVVADPIEDALDVSNTCPKCKNRLKVRNTYITPGGRVQRRTCESPEGCGSSFTATIIVEMTENKKRGDGAYAVAKRLRREHAPD